LPAITSKYPLLVLPADIATIDVDRKWTIGSRNFVPAPLAAFDETELFVAQFPLQPLCHIRDMLANGITGSSIGSTSCKSFDVIP
jgi:hypothetical protein